ncbi:transposase [Pseudarthrobacter psychrotolerans]|uniref:Transposase n=1 Tax=Pseudarthrobacter psychrotolerans TaxID=2697569 RepID=A0A6P1NQN2_9MICC|nr:transposase [Pseudarthrobacter psychrotolerans]
MDIPHERCARIDISNRDAKVCVRLPSRRAGQYSSNVTTRSSTTNSIVQLRDHLLEQEATLVAMEATGDYWKASYYLLEDGLNVELVNARQVRNMRGRIAGVSAPSRCD